MSALFGIAGKPAKAAGCLEAMTEVLRHRGQVSRFQEVLEDNLHAGLLPHPADPSTGIFASRTSTLMIAGSVPGWCREKIAAVLEGPETGFGALRGCFVAASWNRTTRDLILLRDGAGRRTLYYAEISGGLAFAIEPKGIHRLPGFERRLNPGAVAQYLAFSFVPEAATMLEGIRELPAGCGIRWNAQSRQLRSFRWFRPEVLEPEHTSNHPDAYWLERFRERFTCSLEALLPPDPRTPVAAFLSGGIDSSLVVAELAKRHDRPTPHTFSLHFGRALPNELGFARAVAEQSGTIHKEVQLTPKSFAKRLRQLVWHLDDPIGDPVALANFELARHVGQLGFRHVFNGEGGDPCFGGPKNTPMLLAHWYASPEQNGRFREQAYLRSFRRAYEEIRRLLTPEFLKEVDEATDLEAILSPHFESELPRRFLNKLTGMNIRLKGAHLILPKVERMLGAAGLVPCSPLFDESIIELSYQLPGRLKLAAGREKIILKLASEGLLPPSVIARPKVGMRVPMRAWFQKDMRRLAKKLFNKRRLRADGIFNAERIAQLLDFRTEEGPGRNGMRLWMLTTFELWRRVVIEDEERI